MANYKESGREQSTRFRAQSKTGTVRHQIIRMSENMFLRIWKYFANENKFNQKSLYAGTCQDLHPRYEPAPFKTPGYFSRAKGVEVWDLDGNKYYIKKISLQGISARHWGWHWWGKMPQDCASTISLLKSIWQEDLETWKKRDLFRERYVCLGCYLALNGAK